jgi:hypothetical protein
VIYTVSYQFVSRSIEAWFDVQGGRRAGRRPGPGQGHAGHAGRPTWLGKTRVAAERLADTAGRRAPLALERLREQIGAASASLVGAAARCC